MKNRTLIFLTIVVALLNLIVFGSKNISQSVDLKCIVNIRTANAESSTYNDCQGVPTEVRYIYNDGENVAIAYNYTCVGNTGPCCSGWIVVYYEYNPGGTSSPDFSEDHRVHTRC